MTDNWNYNMSQAPRGYYETRIKTGPKGDAIEYQHFVSQRIIACDDKDTVTVSRWIPETEKSPGRWNMFATGQEPMAWQPWPEHPGVKP